MYFPNGARKIGEKRKMVAIWGCRISRKFFPFRATPTSRSGNNSSYGNSCHFHVVEPTGKRATLDLLISGLYPVSFMCSENLICCFSKIFRFEFSLKQTLPQSDPNLKTESKAIKMLVYPTNASHSLCEKCGRCQSKFFNYTSFWLIAF